MNTSHQIAAPVTPVPVRRRTGLHPRLTAWALASCALASCAGAQSVVLWNNSRNAPDNMGVFTGSLTLSGILAPVGGGWSEIPSDATGANAIAGFAGGLTEPAGGFRFADDFTVPPSTRWLIEKVVFFAYHVAPSGTIILPFDKINLRVAAGSPASPSSATVFGDTTTNRQLITSSVNSYRVFNTLALPLAPLPDYTRIVQRLEVATPGLSLYGGTYWLDWQFVDASPLAEVFVPPVTHRFSRGVAGANALQFRPLALVGGGEWYNLVDPGKPSTSIDVLQDLPFIIHGRSVCVADLDGDGGVDLGDFFNFLAGFDQSTGDGDVNSDGVIDLTDFFLFLSQFDSGC